MERGIIFLKKFFTFISLFKIGIRSVVMERRGKDGTTTHKSAILFAGTGTTFIFTESPINLQLCLQSKLSNKETAKK